MPNQLRALEAAVREHDLGLSDALASLSACFGQASSTNYSEVVYGTRPGWSLTVKYGKRGQFAGLDAKRDLDDEALAEVLTMLRGRRTHRVATTVLFSYLPVAGSWRYRDWFQISAVPDSFPQAEYSMAGGYPLPYPFFIEVAYSGSENKQLDDYRSAVATREATRILSGVVRHIDDRLGSYPHADWFIPIDSGDSTTHPSPRLGWLGYALDDYRRVAAEFTPITAETRAIPHDPHYGYYAKRGFTVGQLLTLPETVEDALSTYRDLPALDQDRFLHWCHWLNHAQQISNLSASASTIAAAQAIEALTPESPAGAKCVACGREDRLSIRARVKKLLEEYAPGDEYAAARQELYDYRSKFTHGSSLFYGELRHSAFGEFGPRSWIERDLSHAALLAARTAGVNYLLGLGREPSDLSNGLPKSARE